MPDYLAWDDADLDALATADSADIKGAAATWERDAPGWATLLLGVLALVGLARRAPAAPGFTWDPTRLQYRTADGQLVPHAAVRQAVDTVIDASGKRLVALTAGLRAGTTDLASWQQQVADEVMRLHLTTAAAARGGWAQMAPADYQRVADQLRPQLAYLQGFAQDLATGRQPLDGRAGARAALYAQAARDTYEATRREQMAQRPGMQERRRLHAKESCAACVAEAAKGWRPIGTLAPIGSLTCRANCRCSWDHRVAPAAAA